MILVRFPISHANLRFHYTNWRDEAHDYTVRPESLEYGRYSPKGAEEAIEDVWVLHANVVLRDGIERPGRRTFMLDDLRNLEMA